MSIYQQTNCLKFPVRENRSVKTMKSIFGIVPYGTKDRLRCINPTDLWFLTEPEKFFVSLMIDFQTSNVIKMTNNDILKKLRVALKLRDEDIIQILKLVDFPVSKSEISALFRAEDHPNYVECGDQLLRNFLNGLIIYMRGPASEEKKTAPEKKAETREKPRVIIKKSVRPKGKA